MKTTDTFTNPVDSRHPEKSGFSLMGAIKKWFEPKPLSVADRNMSYADAYGHLAERVCDKKDIHPQFVVAFWDEFKKDKPVIANMTMDQAYDVCEQTGGFNQLISDIADFILEKTKNMPGEEINMIWRKHSVTWDESRQGYVPRFPPEKDNVVEFCRPGAPVLGK